MNSVKKNSASKNRGVMIVIVLVVVAILSLSVLAFSRFMLAERKGASQSFRQRQARLLAESGIEYLRVFLAKYPYIILEMGSIYDNPDEFCGHIVTDGSIASSGVNAGVQSDLQSGVDLTELGRFSVIASRLSADDIFDGYDYRYGLEDESCKLNLRWISQVETENPGMGKAMLMRFPGVTETIADSILDWMDADSEPRDFGVEDDYYSTLDPPYYTRNGIPDSLDELLLVQGVTPKLLYGIDWNRNGLLDEGEPGEETLDEFEVTDGSLNLGLISYLTLDSRESIISPEGLPKINVNMDDIEELRTQLSERFENTEWVDYIIAYRQQQPSSQQNTQQNLLSTLTQSGGTSSGTTGTKINSLLDFIQTSTNNTTESTNQTGTDTGDIPQDMQQNTNQSTSQSTTQSTLPPSPFSDDPFEMNDYLPMLYDNLMVSDTPIVGRININQAPRTVLELFTSQDDVLTDSALLLGSALDATTGASLGADTSATSLSTINVAEIIDGILAEREIDPNLIELNEMNYPFWIYTHGIVSDIETMKKLEPYFCTQGSVFKANVVGRFDERSPVVRLEVWLNASEAGGETKKPARIIRIRELTELGPGFASDILGTSDANQLRYTGVR